MTRPLLLIAFVVALVGGAAGSAQQLTYNSGQRVVPAYEGWLKNADGSVDLLFGYMNQNWDEELDIPVGPDNSFSPGPVDQGQPTHFLPRRNRFVFRVRTPADLGTTEMIWTLTSRGKMVKAYASLKPDYFLEQMTLISEKGGIGGGGAGSAEGRVNKAPTLTLEGAKNRRVKVGEPLTLVAAVADDGLPKPRAQQTNGTLASPSIAPPRNVTVNSAVGLRVSWYVLRGAGKVTFDPPQIKVWEDTREGANSPWAPRWVPPPIPPEGRLSVDATFQQPGVYVLRCLADDGGLWDDGDVIVTVTP